MVTKVMPTTQRLDAARGYLRRGWQPISVPEGTKGPRTPGWQSQRYTEADLPGAFAGSGNIGILLGEPSGGLVDVDLDCEEAVELAEQYLPPTPVRTGHGARPRSHWWYRVPGIHTKRYSDPRTKEVVLELRSTGAQTLVGPSVHPETGEVYDLLEGEPASVTAESLITGITNLYNAVLERRYGPSGPVQPHPVPARQPDPRRGDDDERALRRAEAYLDKMPGAISGQGGHNATYTAATALVHGFGLSEPTALRLLEERYNLRCQPPWTRRELEHKVREAATKEHDRPYGWLRDAAPGAGSSSRRTRPALVEVPDDDEDGDDGDDGHGRVPERDGGRAVILIDTDEFRVVSEAVEALRGDEGVFCRGPMLVRVLRDAQPKPKEDAVARPQGSPVIAALPPANLRERLTAQAAFLKMVKKKFRPAHPPPWLVSAVHERGEWPGLRHLTAIADAPVLRPDGTVWQTTGYDDRTGVLYEPSRDFPAAIPESPTRDDAWAAAESLMEVVHDFRFESEDHRAAYLAALLTPLARHAFSGPAPLFLIDANIRGAGKGLLAQTIGRIALGRDMPVSSYAHDSEEMRKKITAIAIAADPVILLDNLEGSFGNDALDRALTCTRWKDRILGRSEQADLPLQTVWYATGNNVVVGADAARRLVHIRLDVLEENPEERGGFRHPDLLAWVAAERPRLLAAGLTILSAFIRAGRPSQGLTPMGSFEGWSATVREAVVWAGLSDPCRSRGELVARSDSTRDTLAEFISAWKMFIPDGEGVVVAEMLAGLYPPDRTNWPMSRASVAMRAAPEGLVGCPPGKPPSPRQVGAKLKSFRRRPVGGAYLDSNPDEYNRAGSVWRLHRVGATVPEAEGSASLRLCESVSSPYAREMS